MHLRPLLVDFARLSRMAYFSPEQVQKAWQSVHNVIVVPPVASCDDTMNVEDSVQVALQGDLTEVYEVLKRVPSPPVFFNDVTSDAQAYGLTYTKNNNVEGDKEEDESFTVLVFRGTSSFQDALTDLSLCQVPIQNAHAIPASVRVHSGFLNTFEQLRSQCEDFMRDHPGPVVCCAHSLGAAAACIAALVLAVQPSFSVHCVAFGSPRVGNAAWADCFKKHVVEAYYVKNSADPVCSSIPRIQYEHVYTSDTYVHVGGADPWPDVCLLQNIPDHKIDNYIDNLKKGETAEQPRTIPILWWSLYNIPVHISTWWQRMRVRFAF